MGKRILVRDGRLWLDNICLVPVISGRVAFAHEVKETFLNTPFDCIAVGLPDSFHSLSIQGINVLPYISVIVSDEGEEGGCSYFPVDPCDGMIEAIRLGMEEGLPIRCIDREMDGTPLAGLVLPDEYAVHRIGLSAYVQTAFSAFTAKEEDIQARHMASRLQTLSFEYKRVLCVFSVHHLPGILHYYQHEYGDVPTGRKPREVRLFSVHPDSLYFALGELPYITYQYERLKGTLSFEEFEKTEAVKMLLIEARDEFHKEFREEIYRIGHQDIQTALQFIRNLCILKKRLTPDLYELVVGAKGVMGNDFAIKLLEVARFYPFMDVSPAHPLIKMTDRYIDKGGSAVPAFRRVPTLAREWRRISLEKSPDKRQKRRWRTYWNPDSVCSWPPEDEIIENFCGYIRKRALKLVGISQVRVEEFQSTLKDGIHLRETLRNLHIGKIYVKEEPQIQGEVGAVIFIFDEDREGDKYPYKLTWHAEHENESTLVFYATDFKDDLVGPSIGRSFYGGALFLYPPQLIPDVWTNPRFDAAGDNAERLMMAGLYYSRDRYVAVVAHRKPSPVIREYARIQQKRLVFLPLSAFSHKTLQKLRYFHVLNGKHVRNWAAHFIRGR
ncbi:MAG: hypothetical protein ACMUIS_03730 [bacterium]